LSASAQGLCSRSIRGQTVCGRLKDVPEAIDLVDILRNCADTARFVDEALALRPNPKVIWMQLRVRSDSTALAAEPVPRPGFRHMSLRSEQGKPRP
jgi:predicted CoA-binding protein